MTAPAESWPAPQRATAAPRDSGPAAARGPSGVCPGPAGFLSDLIGQVEQMTESANEATLRLANTLREARGDWWP